MKEIKILVLFICLSLVQGKPVQSILGFQPTRSNSGRLNDEVYPTRRRLNLNNELFPEKLMKKFINDGIIGRDTYFWDAGIRPTRRNSGRLNDEVYPTRRRLNLNNELFREKSIKKFNNDGISGQDMHFSDTGFQLTGDSRERLNDVVLPTGYKLNERHFVNNLMKKANDGGISGTGTG